MFALSKEEKAAKKAAKEEEKRLEQDAAAADKEASEQADKEAAEQEAAGVGRSPAESPEEEPIKLDCPVRMGSVGLINPHTGEVHHFNPEDGKLSVPHWAAHILLGNQGCTRAG